VGLLFFGIDVILSSKSNSKKQHVWNIYLINNNNLKTKNEKRVYGGCGLLLHDNDYANADVMQH
jgi:hypothetical protein